MITLSEISDTRSIRLLLADIFGFCLVVGIALVASVIARWILLGFVRFPSPDDTPRIIIVFLPAFFLLIWRSWSQGHYSQFRPFWAELQEVAKIVGAIAAFDLFLLFIIGVQFSRLWFGFFLIFICVVIPYGRELTKLRMIRQGIWYQPTYIIGAGSSAFRTANALKSDSSLGYEIVGFVDLLQSSKTTIGPDNIPIARELTSSTTDRLRESPRLIFALDTLVELEQCQSILASEIASSRYVTVVPPSFGLPLYGASVVGIFRHDTALLKVQNRLMSRRSQYTKRLSDVIIGTVCLILFSPMFLGLWYLIRRDGGPMLFKHRRIGREGKEFDCYKFRSMVSDNQDVLDRYLEKNPDQQAEWTASRKLKHDPRVTKIGHYLRRTSIDELPQLINVLKGEMSLIGPRPIVQDELHLYGQFRDYYLSMTPGMTGLWQVSGRTDTTYNERVRLDVWYTRNWSLWTDLVVLIKTVKTLIGRHGAY